MEKYLNYINYIIDNIRIIGIYGIILVIICYVALRVKSIYDDNKSLNDQVNRQSKDIETQKKIINAIQNNKSRTLSDNFKRMRSEK